MHTCSQSARSVFGVFLSGSAALVPASSCLLCLKLVVEFHQTLVGGSLVLHPLHRVLVSPEQPPRSCLVKSICSFGAGSSPRHSLGLLLPSVQNCLKLLLGPAVSASKCPLATNFLCRGRIQHRLHSSQSMRGPSNHAFARTSVAVPLPSWFSLFFDPPSMLAGAMTA